MINGLSRIEPEQARSGLRIEPYRSQGQYVAEGVRCGIFRGLLQKIGYRGDASGWGSLVSVSVTTETSGPRQSRTPPELQVKTKRLRWLLGLVGLVLVGGIGAGTVLVAALALFRSASGPGLQSTFKTTVTVGGYRRFYFPHPGCELEMVRFERPTKIGREKPLATVQKIRITGRYSDLLFRPFHLAMIEVNGLRVRIPAPGEPKNWNEDTDEKGTSSRVSVGRLIADGAVLEVEKEKGDVPLKFEIHKLLLDSIVVHEPMNYEVSMSIPEPPGELASKGKFGPWEDG